MLSLLYGPTCNMSVSRNVLDKFRFDERFPSAAFEDVEFCLNKKAKYSFMDIQPGDVKKTVADIDYSKSKLGYSPKTSLKKGISNFINWYKAYSKN